MKTKAYILEDFFYVCQAHLKDRGFASPIVDDADVAAKRRKEEMDREVELVTKEYEEKLKKKKKSKDKKAKTSEKGKDKEKEDSKATEADDDDAKMEKEKNDEVRSRADAHLPHGAPWQRLLTTVHLDHSDH